MARLRRWRRGTFALGVALLGVEHRVVLQLGVAPEPGLVGLRRPGVGLHEVRIGSAVRDPGRLDGIQPGVVHRAGPVAGCAAATMSAMAVIWLE